MTADTRGFSTLEVLLASALTLALASGALVGLRTVLTSKQTISKYTRDSLTLARVEQTILRAHEADSSHNFELGVRVHAPGEVTLTDGTPNSIHSGTPNLRPNGNSNALTFVALAPELAYYPRSITANDESASIEVCRALVRFPSKAATGVQFETILGIAVDGMSELRVQSLTEEDPDGCRTFYLQRCKSMAIESASEISLGTIAALIPITEQATLYLSTSTELRYLAHRCGENSENQPVASHIELINCGLTGILNNHSTLLDCIVQTITGQQLKISSVRQLGSSNGFSILMNRL